MSKGAARWITLTVASVMGVALLLAAAAALLLASDDVEITPDRRWLVRLYVPDEWRPETVRAIGTVKGYRHIAQDGPKGEELRIVFLNPDPAAFATHLRALGYIRDPAASTPPAGEVWEKPGGLIQSEMALPCPQGAGCERTVVVFAYGS